MRSAVIIVGLIVLAVAPTLAADSIVSVWGAENTSNTATSSWYGNVGLIATPSAFTPPATATSLGVHWVNRHPDATWMANINFGVTAELEVGGAWIQSAGDEEAESDHDSSQTIINAKYRLSVAKWLEEPNLPDMAVGCFDIANQINRSIYLVLSKGFRFDPTDANSPCINLHAGWASSDSGEGAMDGFFGGLEFNALKDCLVQAEYDGENFNADLRYNLTKGLSLEGGILNEDPGFGLTYRSEF
ncbi:YjbH domain-containing protein [bacterium]|nr:YjbH domain-containing protein [bacterium]